MQNPPFVSIIIPTYNREKFLSITIDSFLAQNYPENKFEIIISNNNSSDKTQQIIDEYCSKYQNVKTIFESRQGVHYARNSAAKVAKGEILYFTDDDMIAEKDLLIYLVKIFNENKKVGSATGRVLPKWEVDPPEWILKYCYNYILSINDQGAKTIISQSDIGVYSCHQAILRELFFKSGGFNPENTAGEWIGDGETGLNIKIKELGYEFAYVGNSIIYHMIPPVRMTQEYLNKRFANQGNSDSYTAYRRFNKKNFFLFKSIINHIANIFRILLISKIEKVFSKDSWHIKTAIIYYHKSRLKYDFRLTYDKKWQKLVLKNDWLND